MFVSKGGAYPSRTSSSSYPPSKAPDRHYPQTLDWAKSHKYPSLLGRRMKRFIRLALDIIWHFLLFLCILYNNEIALAYFRDIYFKGKVQYQLPPCDNLNQLLFILKILFIYFTKQATLMRRATVLSLPFCQFSMVLPSTVSRGSTVAGHLTAKCKIKAVNTKGGSITVLSTSSVWLVWISLFCK